MLSVTVSSWCSSPTDPGSTQFKTGAKDHWAVTFLKALLAMIHHFFHPDNARSGNPFAVWEKVGWGRCQMIFLHFLSFVVTYLLHGEKGVWFSSFQEPFTLNEIIFAFFFTAWPIRLMEHILKVRKLSQKRFHDFSSPRIMSVEHLLVPCPA